MSGPLKADADHVWSKAEPLLRQLSGKRVFLTGGTGFFGKSFLEIMTTLAAQHSLDLHFTILTRDAKSFEKNHPSLALSPIVKLWQGDIVDFPFLEGRFDYVIHAATPASAKMNIEQPSFMLKTIVHGTERALEQARRSEVERFLFVSSGAAFGRQPPSLSHTPDDYPGAPDSLHPASAYGEGKRVAELMCILTAKETGMKCPVARCFAFVGPHLPLDGSFAIGNFIRDGLAGHDLNIQGDGSPFRSYLYSADLVIWLLTLLLKGESGRSYNVGSDEDLNIETVARKVIQSLDLKSRLHIAKERGNAPPERYVPSIERARKELGLDVWIPLQEAIRRTAQFHREKEQHG